MKSERNKLKISFLITAFIFLCSAGNAAGSTSKQLSSQTLRSMARVYLAFGEYDKAQPLAEQALRIALNQNTEASELAICYIDMGTVYQYRLRLDDAENMLSRGIELQRNCLGPMHPYIAYTLQMLSSVYRQQDRSEFAQRALDEAINIMLDTHAPDETAMNTFYIEQAKILAAQDHLDEAHAIYQKTLRAAENTYGATHLCTASILEELAQLELRRNKLETASDFIDQTIAIRTRYYGRNNPMLVSAYLTKARICTAAGNLADSDRNIAQAVNASDKVRNPVKLARLHEQIAQIKNSRQLASL